MDSVLTGAAKVLREGPVLGRTCVRGKGGRSLIREFLLAHNQQKANKVQELENWARNKGQSELVSVKG